MKLAATDFVRPYIDDGEGNMVAAPYKEAMILVDTGEQHYYATMRVQDPLLDRGAHAVWVEVQAMLRDLTDVMR